MLTVFDSFIKKDEESEWRVIMTVSSVCQIVFSGKIILGEVNGCGGEKGSNELENAALNKVKVMNNLISFLPMTTKEIFSIPLYYCVPQI